MLKHRIITAAIILPLFILAILFIPAQWFAILTGVMVAIAAWEWSSLVPVKRLPMRVTYTVVAVIAVGLSFFMPLTLLLLDLLLWIWAFAAILCFSKTSHSLLLGFDHRAVKAVVGFLLLTAFWLAVNVLRNTLVGPKLLLFGFCLVWAVDIAAYFVGRCCGKHFLAPKVSPNKTWEGAIGGVIACMAVSLAYGFFESMPWHQLLLLVVLALVVAVFAIIGDLFESLLKRQANVKDSGSIFPGHGGMLDRFDGAFAALPIFALVLLIL